MLITPESNTALPLHTVDGLAVAAIDMPVKYASVKEPPFDVPELKPSVTVTLQLTSTLGDGAAGSVPV